MKTAVAEHPTMSNKQEEQDTCNDDDDGDSTEDGHSTLEGFNVWESVWEDQRGSLRADMAQRLTNRVRFLRLRARDHIKTSVLVGLSLATLPFSLMVAGLLSTLPLSWITYLVPFSAHTPASAAAYRQNCRAQAGFCEKTILVTGINMTKGLTLARAFYLAGHRVIGADFDALNSSVWLPQWLGGRRFSWAFAAVYDLERPAYTQEMTREEQSSIAERYAVAMVRIMDEQEVHLWVSCSGVATAVEDGMVTSKIRNSRGSEVRMVVQFDEDTTKKLHEKSTFTQYMKELKLGVPETHVVVSRRQASRILLDTLHGERCGLKFILKPVGMDDAHRGNMTLLPLAVRPDAETYPGQATEAYVHQLPISQEKPWILQQYIWGDQEYCTHALVVKGEVKVFVACPSSDMLMHYQALPAHDVRRKRMLSFTKAVARDGGSQFTGHLSFDFMVEHDPTTSSDRMYAIECNPRAHTAVALFATPGPEMRDMVDAYMSVLKAKERAPRHPEYRKWHLEQLQQAKIVEPPMGVKPRYWLGHDLVALLLLPLLKLLVWPFSLLALIGSVRAFLEHVLFWKDGVFELWDPWPFVALYHVYWPLAMMRAWRRGERWSRANVSTTKMFAC